MTTSRIFRLSEKVRRIGYCGMFVDIVETSEGTVRIGSMPDIAKFQREHDIHERMIVIPDWEVSQAGDNRTGEEFILWQAQIRNGPLKEYVGAQCNVDQMYHHLGRIFPYFFDESRLKIERKNWLDNWFHPNTAEPQYRLGKLEITCTGGNVVLSDDGQVVYDRARYYPDESVDNEIERLLASVPRDNVRRDTMEITPVGCGNGFYGTAANSIVRYGEYVIWIDPCGYPAQTLAKQGIHWDDITHCLFTHNHEDHVQGFTACVQRARKTGRKLNLLVTNNVFSLLKELYTPLFPDLEECVTVWLLDPEYPLELGPVTIETRWNHHILPYGTVGLKISAGGKVFGYSGDTKYDESLNRLLGRSELTAQWFAECDLVLHEIDFNNPDSVHTHWEQVALLQEKISGTVLGYHTPFLEAAPFPLAEEGKRYLL